MCRSIKVLRDGPTPEDISAAALQFVRKISGSRHPSKVNEAVFNKAVEEIAKSSATLLSQLKARNDHNRIDS
jgi:hypothetical protein